MQKIITIRASQGNLNKTLTAFTRAGWKVLSVTKGSELGRVGFSYKWTVVLENMYSYSNPNDVDNIVYNLQKLSLIDNVMFIFMALVIVGVIVALIVCL